MRKKYVLGSAFIALLLLASMQVMLINTVKSDPQAHVGDGDIGELWISELDVTSAVNGFENVGISHVTAEEDWLLWEEGTGNINASWSVDIGNRHPEYYVIFSLGVYNIEEPMKEMGNATFRKTYNQNVDYDESGTLSVALEFSQQEMQKESNTLVCFLGACIRINNTFEATNFSSAAQDRCVVAVEFTCSGVPPPFFVYREEANNQFPSMWSWIDGWDEEERFTDENDMLNSQTFFKFGTENITYQPQEEAWQLGNISFFVKNIGTLITSYEVTNSMVTWIANETTGWINGYSFMNYSVYCGARKPKILMRYVLWSTEVFDIATIKPGSKTWKYGDNPNGFMYANISTHVSYDKNDDGNISMSGIVWGTPVYGIIMLPSLPVWLKSYSYKVNYTYEGNSSFNYEGDDDYCWKESCAYQVGSFNPDVSSTESQGITTVEANIYEVMQSSTDGEIIYTFGGDNQDVLVEFACES